MEKTLIRRYITYSYMSSFIVTILCTVSVPYMMRLCIMDVSKNYMAILSVVSSLMCFILNRVAKHISRMDTSFNIFIIGFTIIDILVSAHLIMTDNKVGFYVFHSIGCCTFLMLWNIKMRTVKTILNAEDRMVLDSKVASAGAIGSLIASTIVLILPELDIKILLIIYIGLDISGLVDIYIKNMAKKIARLQKEEEKA